MTLPVSNQALFLIGIFSSRYVRGDLQIVPFWALVLLMTLPVPLIAITYSVLKKSWHDAHAALMALVQGFSLEWLFVQVRRLYFLPRV